MNLLVLLSALNEIFREDEVFLLINFAWKPEQNVFPIVMLF